MGDVIHGVFLKDVLTFEELNSLDKEKFEKLRVEIDALMGSGDYLTGAELEHYRKSIQRLRNRIHNYELTHKNQEE